MAQREPKSLVQPVSEMEVANFSPLTAEEESALLKVDTTKPAEVPAYFQSLEHLRSYILKRPGLVGRRHKYSAERLMMLLDNERLAALEDEFNEHPRGIKLANFVWLMESAIDYPPEEKIDLVYGLVKLFQDIDINGDLHMEWSEFTQYVIDCVLQEGTVVQENEVLGEATPTEVLEQAGGGRGRRFQVSELTDPTTHHNPLRKIVPTGKADGFYVLEENSAAIKEYNNRLCPVRKIEPARLGLYAQKSTIQAFDYDPTNDILGFVTSDKKAYFHDGGGKQALLHVAEKFRRAAAGIWHMPVSRLWAVSWVDHSITFWREITSFKAHTELITECCEISISGLIATASLDGYIRIWTSEDLKLKTELEDLDAKKAAAKSEQTTAGTRNIAGIRSLSYTPENGGYLLSAGYTPYVNVWSPDTSLSKAFIGRLEGHAGVVIAARIFQKSTLAVSVDDRFNIRTWDLRALKPLQNIRNDTLNPSSVTCLATLPGEARFIIGGRRILLFTNEHTRRDQLAFQEDLHPLEVEFNPYFGTLQVLTKHDVRVFSAYSGRIRQVFTDLFEGGLPVELTAMAPGPRERKFFLADNSGNVKLFNARSGDQIKALLDADSFSPGSKKMIEITQIIFVETQGLLLMVSNDSSIRVAEWKAAGDTVELLRELRGGHKGADITCAVYSKETLTLYTGGSDGGIACWAFESAKLSAYLKYSNTDITAVQDLFPYPAVASADSKGMIAIYKSRDWRKSPPLLWLIPVLDSKGIPRPLTTISVLSGNKGGIWTMPSSELYNKHATDSAVLVSPNKMVSFEEVAKMEKNIRGKHSQLEMFVGGTAGWIHVIPVEVLLKMRGVEPLAASDFNERRWEKFKVSLMRKDNLNAEISVQKAQEELALLYPAPESRFFGIPSEIIAVRKWKAHSDMITVISPLHMFCGMLTGGKDRLIKLWNWNGEPWGSFSLLGTQVGSWKFPLDWVTKVLSDLDDVLNLISLLEKAEFAPDQIPLIQTRYLYRNYILPEVKLLQQIEIEIIPK